MECQTLPTTKCVLCLRPTEKMSDENICRQQKIADVYMTYLKPKLTTVPASNNWSSLVKERSSNCQFCSDCMKAGQNLTSMNDQLLALQCAIQDFVQNLSKEILKYRDELDTCPHHPVDSVPPNPQQFSNHSAYVIEVKEEEIMDVEENISNQSVNPQHHLENQASIDITGKTSVMMNGNELSLESNAKNARKRKKPKKDVLKSLQFRKLGISWQPQCSKCDKVCLDRETLKDHMMSVHSRNKFAFCAQCPDLEKFTDRYKYEIHIMTHTEEIPYDCPKCHEKFSNAKNYCEHQTSSDCANSDRKFVCSKCDEVFRAKYLLLTHTTVFHKANENTHYALLQCDLCETLPMLQCYLEDHYAEHTEEFIIPCDICGMSLQNLEIFDEHRKSHRSSVGIPYRTFDKTLLEEDDDDEDFAIEYSCEQCNKKFIDETKKYLSHIKTCQCNSMQHACDICGKKFSYPDRLANHMKGHTDGFPTCTKCNKQFESEAKLQAHVKKRKSLEDGCELNPVTAKKRKLDQNGPSKLEQNLKHHLEENEQDMDTDGNEIKSSQNRNADAKKRGIDYEANVAIEIQISKILSGENISLDEDNADENLECSQCSIKFSDFNSFEAHMLKEHKETTFRCSHCNEIFLNRRDKERHSKSAHPRTDELLCAACPDLEKFPNVYECEIHCMTHTEEIPYDCPTCHEKFSNAKTYCEHQKSSACANSGGKFQCVKCEAVFQHKCLLLAHMTVFHKGKGKEKKDYTLSQCELCEKPPMQKFHLEDHYAEHTKEFIIPCDICGMILQNFSILNVHRKSHRAIVAIPCSLCDEKFKNLLKLRLHIKMMHTEGQVVTEETCEHCGMKFIGKAEKYRRHIEACSKFHICDTCGKKFFNPDHLANHMKRHTEGFPTCTKCNKQFETEAKLKAHVKKRKGLEDGCELNPVAAKKRKFDQNGPSKLEENAKHLSEENESRMDIDGNEIKSIPNKSTEEKKLASDYELNVAIEEQISKILSGENISLDEDIAADENHDCTLCNLKFSDFNSFEAHMFKDHKETTVQCSNCEEIFLNQKDKVNHAKSVHPRTDDLLCAACPNLEKFSNVYECEMHYTEEIPYDCPTCHEKFSNAKNYSEHQKSSDCANSGGQFACAKCEAAFKSKCLLLTHMTVFHNGKGKEKKDYTLFQCELCDKTPMQKFHLEDHYAEHTKEFMIPCDICGMLLQSFSFLNVHRKSHRATVAIPCSSCDEKFKNLLKLRLHIKMMHTEGQVVTEDTCEHCGMKFIGRAEKYRRHIESCSKFHICDVCGKKFFYPDRLANHMKGHTDGFPTCTVCNKQFESAAKLKAHSDKMHLEKQMVIDESCGETSM